MPAKLSVLIPSYNHEKYIASTIQSVLDQTFDNFELIIGDDASTDSSRSVIDSFDDQRIKKVYFEKNVGTVRNLNRLLSVAQGEYIAVLGSDDRWLPEKLKTQINFLEQNKNIAAVFSHAYIIDQNGDRTNNSDIKEEIFNVSFEKRYEWLRHFYSVGNCICHSGAVIRKDIHDKIGNYNVAYRQLHDFDLWTRLISKYEVAVIKKPLVEYRRASDNTSSISAANSDNTIRVYNELENIIYDMICSLDEGSLSALAENISNDGETDPKILKFLLIKNFAPIGKPCPAMIKRYLFENADDAFINLLEERYGITLKEIYGYTAGDSPFAENDVNKLNRQLDDMKIKLKIQESTLNEIFESTSWKIAKKLSVLGKIKNIFR